MSEDISKIQSENKEGTLKRVILAIVVFLAISLVTPIGDLIKDKSDALWERFFGSPHIVVIFTETTNREIGEENIKSRKSSFSFYKEFGDDNAVLVEKYYIDLAITELFLGTGLTHSIVGVIPPEGAKSIDVTIANISRKPAKNVELKIEGRDIDQIRFVKNEKIDDKLSDVACKNSIGCSISIQKLVGRSAVYLSFVDSNPESILGPSCKSDGVCQIDITERQAVIIPLGKYIDINYVDPDKVIRTPLFDSDDTFCHVIDDQSYKWVSLPICYGLLSAK